MKIYIPSGWSAHDQRLSSWHFQLGLLHVPVKAFFKYHVAVFYQLKPFKLRPLHGISFIL